MGEDENAETLAAALHRLEGVALVSSGNNTRVRAVMLKTLQELRQRLENDPEYRAAILSAAENHPSDK